jgi:general secretion pathway protein A
VFAAPPEFDQILEHHQLQSLKQRITVRAKIPPLNAEESAEYIEYRLSLVAESEEPAFTKDAIKMIAAKAKGIPRIINIICDNALVTGMGYRQKPVNPKIVKEVISDLKAVGKSNLKMNTMKWAPFAAGLAIVLVIGLLFTMFKAFSVIDDQRAQLTQFQQPTIMGKIDAVPHEQANPATEQTITATSGQTNLPASGGEKTDKSAVKQISKDDPAAVGAIKQTVSIISEGTPDKPSSVEKQPEGTDGINQRNESTGIKETTKISRKGKKYPIKAIVKKKDNLYRLTIQAYGFSNDQVLMFVKKNNPSIKDIRYIEVGSTIIFPPLDKSLKESNNE